MRIVSHTYLMKMNTTSLKGVKLHEDFWNDYAQRLNDYHHMINCNYENGRITLKEKCKAHKNVDEFFADFYLESAQLV